MWPPTTRVLVVDDMMAMRQLVKSQLRGLGFKNIVDAENGREALNTLEVMHASGEPVTLIVSDWNMPEMTGLELLKKVRSTPHLKDIPFLMVTAEGEQRQVVEAIKSGVSNYLVKPFTPAGMQEKLLAVWKKHNPGK